MTAKEFFKRVYEADKAISDLKAQRDHYLDLATGTTAALDRVGGFTHGGDSKIEVAGIARADISKMLEARVAEYHQLVTQAHKLIEQLPSAKQRRVMTLRYLCGKSWQEVTDEMGYNDEKSAYRVHGWALKEIDNWGVITTPVL